MLLLRQTVKEGIFMAMDETRVQVMRKEGKADMSESYKWLTKGGRRARWLSFLNIA
ncbi:MAG: hypothetical protein LBG22_01005 [Treponema sp.]|nr:hypothetical protein [Treponema sp.]